MDLAAAVKKHFPDLSKAPPEIRIEMERLDKKSKPKQAPSNIAGEIFRATTEMGEAEDALKELRSARDAHRLEWKQHVEESLLAWQEHLNNYQTQQEQYATLIKAAKDKFSAASAEIQKLNARAGQDSTEPPPLAPLPEETPGDTSIQIKQEALQHTLTGFSNFTEDPIEVDSESDGGTPRPKRVREVKPGAEEHISTS